MGRIPSCYLHSLAEVSRSELQGKCFGNLISPKFVLTILYCILEQKERLVNAKIVQGLIETTMINLSLIDHPE